MSEPSARRRRWPWIALAAVALAAFSVWWWRDLPRRRIEAALEAELRADVTVGRLSVQGSRRFTLHDLRIRRMGGQPYLEVAEVRRVTVEGSLPRLRVADFETMEVLGVTVRLRPSTGERLPEPDTEPSTLKVGHLVLRQGAVVLRAGESETRLPFQAEAWGIGTTPRGELSAQAASLPLGAVFSLLGFPGSTASLQGFQASARLAPGTGASLTARAAAVLVPGERLPAASLTASLTPSSDGKTLAVAASVGVSLARELQAEGTLEAASLALQRGHARATGVDLGALLRLVPLLPAGTTLAGSADIDVTLLDPARVEVATTATLGTARFTQEGLRIDLDGAALQGSASLVRDAGPLRGPVRARLHLPRIAASGKSWKVPARVAPAVLEVEAEVASVTPPAASGIVRLLTRGVGTWSARGRVEGTPLRCDLAWQGTGLTLASLRATAAELEIVLPDAVALDGRALLSGTLVGPLAAPTLQGKLTADRIEGRLGDRSLRGGALQARFQAPPGMARVELPSIVLSGTAAIPPLAPLPLALDGAARWDTASSRLTVPRATVRSSPGLGILSLEGTWQPGAAGAASAKARLQGADLPAWLPVLRPILGDPVAGYTVRGSLEAQGAARIDARGAFTGEGQASIAKSGFASEDGARVLQGLDSQWALRGEGSGGAWRAEGDGELGGFQLLWGTVFADYSALRSRAVVSAHGGVPGEPPWNVEMKTEIPDGPSLDVALHPGDPGALLWSSSLEIGDLARTASRHLRAPLGESLPLFEKIEAKGRLELQAAGALAEGSRTLHGGLTLEGVDLTGTEGVVGLSGLDLVLPFDLRFLRGKDGAWALSGPPQEGSVEFDCVEVSGLTLAALRSGVVLVGDDLTFEETLTIPALGGEVRFEALTLKDLLAPSRHLRSGVLVTGVALAETAKAFGLPPLEGSVEALFPQVRLDATTLLVEGGGEVGLFGGTVHLGDISGEDVLSRFPKLQLSAEFSGIDLGRVTRTFDFGEMNGVVEGYVRDLRLFRGVPVSFEASIHSVPTEGVPQNVNVKAVRNLTILGTGARISPLDRGLQRFFDKYTYAELGVWMQLQADVFVLRGNAGRQGGRELFVRGRLPFPINIVNAQPGKTISFSSMVERVKSVDFSAASTAP